MYCVAHMNNPVSAEHDELPVCKEYIRWLSHFYSSEEGVYRCGEVSAIRSGLSCVEGSKLSIVCWQTSCCSYCADLQGKYFLNLLFIK